MTDEEKSRLLEIIEKMQELYPDGDLLIINPKSYGGINLETGKRIRLVQEEYENE